MDVSIKNNIAISMSYICKDYNIANRLVHYVMNINPVEVKLFTIRCGINQVIKL